MNNDSLSILSRWHGQDVVLLVVGCLAVDDVDVCDSVLKYFPERDTFSPRSLLHGSLSR